MEQEAAQELIDSKSHGPLFVTVGGVAPAESDVAIGKSDQPEQRLQATELYEKFKESCVHLYPNSDTVSIVSFRLQAAVGQPLYLQLMQQIRHAVETGALQNGDQLPGIRTLAEELVVSPNTVAKAYSELEHEGLLELRHGLGAFVLVSRRTRHLADRLQSARRLVGDVIEELRGDGLLEEEIRRMFEAELLIHAAEPARKR